METITQGSYNQGDISSTITFDNMLKNNSLESLKEAVSNEFKLMCERRGYVFNEENIVWK